MAIKGGFDANDIAAQILSALDEVEDAGVKKAEDIGVSIGQAVRDGIVEGSKGLESDNVILINIEDKLLGLPTKKKNKKILKHVNNTKDYYPYEEEERNKDKVDNLYSPKEGLIKVMDEKCTSADLAEALKSNTKIIVSTIQKFRYILDETKNILDKSFARIIDEAHSSTSGKKV